MKLSELAMPRFCARSIANLGAKSRILLRLKALGILCPKCFAENGGPVGTHSVICWSEFARHACRHAAWTGSLAPCRDWNLTI